MLYTNLVSCVWKSRKKICNCDNVGRSSGDIAQQYAITANLVRKHERIMNEHFTLASTSIRRMNFTLASINTTQLPKYYYNWLRPRHKYTCRTNHTRVLQMLLTVHQGS